MSAEAAAILDRAADLCEGGVWLATNEQDPSEIWPRHLYPSADDAIAASNALGDTFGGGDADHEMPCRIRLVDAHDDANGWWYWPPRYSGAVTIECWELSWAPLYEAARREREAA